MRSVTSPTAQMLSTLVRLAASTAIAWRSLSATPDRLEPEPLDVRAAADRPEQHLGLDRLAVGDDDADAAVGLLDPLERRS